MREHNYSVYIMASKSRVLYIGMTNNMDRRVFEHKSDLVDGFSKQYRCHAWCTLSRMTAYKTPSPVKSS